jgi:hypothetical protein
MPACALEHLAIDRGAEARAGWHLYDTRLLRDRLLGEMVAQRIGRLLELQHA